MSYFYKSGFVGVMLFGETLVSYVRLQFVCYYVRGVRSVKNFNYA
jgi:hypothetical protein